jgi:hypothetical protein
LEWRGGKRIMINKALHSAAQYLAAASISFLPKKSDDSHANFEWHQELQAFVTQPLGGRHNWRLGLVVQDFALIFCSTNGIELHRVALAGHTHDAVVHWINNWMTDEKVNGNYRFTFHYDLPSHGVDPFEPFPDPNYTELMSLGKMRSDVHHALARMALKENTLAQVRTWPHHFDTALLLEKGTDVKGRMTNSIGMGLAIPDSVMGSHYAYVNAWDKNGEVPIEKLPPLKHGQWHTDGFRGAVMNAETCGAQELEDFFTHAHKALMSLS